MQGRESELKEKPELTAILVEQGFLMAGLLLGEGETGIESYRTLLGISQKWMFALVLEFGSGRKNTEGSGQAALRKDSYGKIREILRKYYVCYISPWMENRLVCCVPLEKKEEKPESRQEEAARCSGIQREITAACSCVFRVGIGSVQPLECMERSFRDALCALEQEADRAVPRWEPNRANSSEASREAIERAMHYIRKNYRRELSLEELSRTVHMSSHYFSRLFKEVTGLSYVEYLTGIRLECAKELLQKGGGSMKQICIKVGYGDPNYFSRIFKKHVGQTPTEYERTVRGRYEEL